jgi:hypothetical protein
MSRFFAADRGTAPPEAPACDSLFVAGVRYANTAAKFWPALIDEVETYFPACSTIELTVPTAAKLARAHLFPEQQLERDLNCLLNVEFKEALKDILAEIEILGPPSSVSIRLLAEEQELLESELPLECVDAELFLYMLVWPLRWAEIPEEQWNSSFVSGRFDGEDRGRKRLYAVSFELSCRHLSEGMWLRSISLCLGGRREKRPAED